MRLYGNPRFWKLINILWLVERNLRKCLYGKTCQSKSIISIVRLYSLWLDETCRNTLQEKDSNIMMSQNNTPTIEQTIEAMELSFFFSMDIWFSSRFSLICGAWVVFHLLYQTKHSLNSILISEQNLLKWSCSQIHDYQNHKPSLICGSLLYNYS